MQQYLWLLACPYDEAAKADLMAVAMPALPLDDLTTDLTIDPESTSYI